MPHHPLPEYRELLTPQRIHRYLRATRGNAAAASSLYDWNLRYSAFVFANIALWEAALHNRIARHFSSRCGSA